MFKVNNKDTRTYFAPCSNVSIVNFEPVFAGWDMKNLTILQNFFYSKCRNNRQAELID